MSKEKQEFSPEFVTRYEAHELLSSHLEYLYIEVNKMATKRIGVPLTPLISRKINHVIRRVQDLVKQNEYLDAIETVPVEEEQIRYDEALIILGELRGAMKHQYESHEFRSYRNRNNELFGLEELMRS